VAFITIIMIVIIIVIFLMLNLNVAPFLLLDVIVQIMLQVGILVYSMEGLF